MKTCRVIFSVYFLVMITCMLALDSTILTALALFCVAIHEMGHGFFLWLFRVRVTEISFHLFGVEIQTDGRDRLSYRQETLLALGGIFANLLLCGVMNVLHCLQIWRNQAQAVFSMSLFLALFNALPIGSLDGGRALEALVCMHSTPQWAEKILQICSAVLLIPAGIYAFWLLIHVHNVTLLAAVVYLMVSLIWHGNHTMKRTTFLSE